MLIKPGLFLVCNFTSKIDNMAVAVACAGSKMMALGFTVEFVFFAYNPRRIN